MLKRNFQPRNWVCLNLQVPGWLKVAVNSNPVIAVLPEEAVEGSQPCKTRILNWITGILQNNLRKQRLELRSNGMTATIRLWLGKTLRILKAPLVEVPSLKRNHYFHLIWMNLLLWMRL
uniref:Zinc finger protein 638 n=1 Tax=Rousettus aegyptiacus TaxID=9407 RepID=A0A7J8FPV9_ROUAE|nr:zinc finger protein 638 [Rousettus aegyptiacus]